MLYFPISANQITLLGIFLTFLGMVLIIISNNMLYWILALIIFFISLGLDCVDGEVARYKKTSSLTGLLLDRFASSITTFFLYFGVICKSYLLSNSIIPVILGILAILSIFIPRLIMASMYQTAIEGIIKTSNIKGTSIFLGKSNFTTLDGLFTKDNVFRKFIWFLLGYGAIIFLALCFLLENLIEFGLISSISLSFGTIFIQKGFFLTLFLFYYGVFWLFAGLVFSFNIIRNQQVEGLYNYLVTNFCESTDEKAN